MKRHYIIQIVFLCGIVLNLTTYYCCDNKIECFIGAGFLAIALLIENKLPTN